MAILVLENGMEVEIDAEETGEEVDIFVSHPRKLDGWRLFSIFPDGTFQRPEGISPSLGLALDATHRILEGPMTSANPFEGIRVCFFYDIHRDQWGVCDAATGAVIAYCVLGTIPVVGGVTVDHFCTPMSAQKVPGVPD